MMENLIVVGDPNLFAIESNVSEFYKSKGQRALGYFVVYINNVSYGVKLMNATLLACSFDQVVDMLKKSSKQISFFNTVAAQEVADIYLMALFSDSSDDNVYLGKSSQEIREAFYANDVIWAPDGDAAFDDGSNILLFNIGYKVRLIAFKNSESYKATNLQELLIPSDLFYDILDGWKSQFESQWHRAIGLNS